MSAYSSEANVTVNAIQGTTTGITALETGLVSVNNQIQQIGEAITAQGNVMDTMIASVGVTLGAVALQAAQAFGEVEQSMKIVQMISQASSGDIRYLTDQANQLSVQYRLAIDDITEGLQTLGRAGLHSAHEQTEVLEHGLQTAKLEGRDLNGVLEELIQNTALLGGNLKSSKFGDQTEYINDLLVATSLSAPINTHDISETLKYSGGMLAAAGGDLNTDEGKKLIEDYMGAIAAFAQKGVSGSVAGTALRAFFNKPATQDSSVLEGLSQLHLQPEYLWEEGGERMKPISEQIALIQGQMDKLNISTMDQMQIWSKIVGGKMGQQMMKLHSSDIKEMTKDIQDSASAEELATKSMQTFESSVKQLEQTAQSVFRGFGGEVAKALYVPVKLATHLLELLNNPIGSTVLFTGFVTILKKTLDIGWRFLKVFATELQQTLAEDTGQAGSQVKEQIGSSEQYAEEASDNVKNKISDDIDELGNKFDSRMDTSAKKILKVFDEATGKFLYALNPSKYNFNSALNEINSNIEAKNIPKSLGKDFMEDATLWNSQSPKDYETFYNNQEQYQFKLAESQMKRMGLDVTRGAIHKLQHGDLDITSRNRKYRRKLRVDKENLERELDVAMKSLDRFMKLASEPPETMAKEYDKKIRTLHSKQDDFEKQKRYLDQSVSNRNWNFFQMAREKADEKAYAIKVAPVFARWDHLIATQGATSQPEEEPTGHMLDNYSIKDLTEKGWLNLDEKPTQHNFNKIIDNNLKIQELQMQYMDLQSQQKEQVAKMIEDASVNINTFNKKYSDYEITADLSKPNKLLKDVLSQKDNIMKELNRDDGVKASLDSKKQYIDDNYILAAKRKRDELYREGKDRGPYKKDKETAKRWTTLSKNFEQEINKAIEENTPEAFKSIDLNLDKLPKEDQKYWKDLIEKARSDSTIQSIPALQAKVTELSTALQDIKKIEKQLNSSKNNIEKEIDRVKADINKSKNNIEVAKSNIDNIIGYNMGEVKKGGSPKQVTLKAQIDSIESEIQSLNEAQEALVQKYSDKLTDLTRIPKEEIWDLKEHQKLVKSAENDLAHVRESKEYQGRQKRIDELEQERKEKQKQYDLLVPWEETSSGKKYIKEYDNSESWRNRFYGDNLENKDKNKRLILNRHGFSGLINVKGGLNEDGKKIFDKVFTPEELSELEAEFTAEGKRVLAQVFTPKELKILNEQADLSVDTEAIEISKDVLTKEITKIKSDIDDLVSDKRAVLKGNLPTRIQDLRAEIEILKKEINMVRDEMSILDEKEIEEVRTFEEYIKRVEQELGVVDEAIEDHMRSLPKGVTPKEWLDLKLSNPFNTTSVTKWDKEQWDKSDWDKMPGEAEFKKHSMPNPFNNYQEAVPSGFYALDSEEQLRWLQSIKNRSSEFGATKKDEMHELAKLAQKNAKYDPEAPAENYALPASVNTSEILKLEQQYAEKHTGFTNKLRDFWQKNIRGLDLMPDVSGDGLIYNQSVKKQKKSPSSNTLFSSLKNYAVTGLKDMVKTFFSPVMLGFELLNLSTQLLQQEQEKYAKKIGDLSNKLDEAVSKRDEAERQIKDEFANAHPGATDDEKEAYLDQIYANAADSTTHMNKVIDQIGLSTSNFPKYEKDDEEVGVLHEIKQEEQSSGEKIAENTRTLLFAEIEIKDSINRLSSLMSDRIWGTEGAWAKLQDTIDVFSGIITTENANESGTFNTPSKMQSDDYAGYTEEAGVVARQLGDSEGSNYGLYIENFGTKQTDWEKKYLDEYITARLEQTYPKAGKEVWSILPEHARNQYRDQTRLLSRLSPEKRNNLALSQKQDKKNYQKIGKEMAKVYKGDKKALNRISRLVSRIQNSTAANLKKQTVMAAAALQQFQDMKSVAQSVITPLLLEQVQLGAQYAAYGRNTMSSNSSISGSSGTTAANAQIIASFLANQATDESYKAAFDFYSEKGKTDAKNADEFKQEIGDGADAKAYTKEDKTLLAEKRRMVAEGAMFPTIKQQHPDWSDSQVAAEVDKRWNQHKSDAFSNTMNYARKSLANVLDDVVVDAYSNSDIGSDDSSGGSGGGGSGGGGSGGKGSGDKSDNTGTKKERVDLVLCNKKQIPKLDVNLFKKAPQFTILNKNFRLRDIKISTKDKPKAVLDSIKNAIIDTQQRMDPKIVQDEEAEYNPAEATDGKSLPAGSTKTKTK